MSTARLTKSIPDPDPYLEAMAENTNLPAESIRSYLDRPFYEKDREFSATNESEILQKIQRTCQHLGYIPENPLWRARIYPEKADLAFCVGNSVKKIRTNPYFRKMLDTLLEAARDLGIHVIFASFNQDIDYSLEESPLPPEIAGGASNKFVIAGRINTSLVKELIRVGGNVVFLSRASDIPGTVSVVPDYRGAAKQAIQMLYAHGHRSIAIAGANYFQDKGYNYTELTEGAMQAASQLDISLTESDIFISEDSHIGDRPHVIASIRDCPKQYTAVFCLDDAVGAALHEAAGLIHLKIPEDLSLVGCNDQGESDYLYPELSTIHVPLRRMGRQVIKEATGMVLDGPPKSARIVKMATSPTLRRSIAFV